MGFLVLMAGGIFLLRITWFRVRPIEVSVHRVRLGRVEDTVVNSRAGKVESRRHAAMSPAIAGSVVELPVAKGARVKAGDVLLRLDDREHQARVLLAQRSLAAARALAEQAGFENDLAQRLWVRTQKLARDQVVSDLAQEQDRSRALAAAAAQTAAQARIQEAEAAVAVAEATLAKTVIAAPFDGVVLDITTEVGEWISPAPPGVFIPPVIDLMDPEALYVSAPIDEADVSRLRTGLRARITLDAFRDRAFIGEIRYVSSFVETRLEQNRTLRVEADFLEVQLPPNVLPGLSADLEIILDARDDVVRVPTFALLEGGRVLVVGENRLAERQVTTGLRNWSYTEITSGLTTNEPVVISLDRPEVKAGARVTITEETDE